jgi:hypothetical protein
MSPGHDRGAFADPASPPGWDISHVSFGDVLEALNPLQYLPGVGMIYRELTGDSVHPALRIAVAGAVSLLFGGPIGLAATMLISVAGEVLHNTGSSTGTTASPAQWNEAHAAYRRPAHDA